MPRAPRKQSAANLYHVVIRGAGRQSIFEDDNDRRRLLTLLADYAEQHGARVIAYCLMSNHVHLALEIEFDELHAFMKHVESTYARNFNDRHDHVGPLFQGRFWSEPIDDESYLLAVVRYIHMNPVHACLGNEATYPWSSYREYMGVKGICCIKFVLDILGSREEFIALHSGIIPHGVQPAVFLTADGPIQLLPDDASREVAINLLGESKFHGLKALPKSKRNEALKLLLRGGFTIRQIERLTGIGRGIIGEVSSTLKT